MAMTKTDVQRCESALKHLQAAFKQLDRCYDDKYSYPYDAIFSVKEDINTRIGTLEAIVQRNKRD